MRDKEDLPLQRPRHGVLWENHELSATRHRFGDELLHAGQVDLWLSRRDVELHDGDP